MKALITLLLTALASAHAVSPAGNKLQSRDFQTVALNFEAGPASYGLDLVADGQEWFTSTLAQSTPEIHFLYSLSSENRKFLNIV